MQNQDSTVRPISESLPIGNAMLPAVGSVVRLKPEVEQEKTMHSGKYFNVAGMAGRFLILTWGEQKVFFLPDEVYVIAQ